MTVEEDDNCSVQAHDLLPLFYRRGSRMYLKKQLHKSALIPAWVDKL